MIKEKPPPHPGPLGHQSHQVGPAGPPSFPWSLPPPFSFLCLDRYKGEVDPDHLAGLIEGIRASLRLLDSPQPTCPLVKP